MESKFCLYSAIVTPSTPAAPCWFRLVNDSRNNAGVKWCARVVKRRLGSAFDNCAMLSRSFDTLSPSRCMVRGFLFEFNSRLSFPPRELPRFFGTMNGSDFSRLVSPAQKSLPSDTATLTRYGSCEISQVASIFLLIACHPLGLRQVSVRHGVGRLNPGAALAVVFPDKELVDTCIDFRSSISSLALRPTISLSYASSCRHRRDRTQRLGCKRFASPLASDSHRLKYRAFPGAPVAAHLTP